MQFSKSYSEVLDDQINQKNRYEAEQEEIKRDYNKKYTKEGV